MRTAITGKIESFINILHKEQSKLQNHKVSAENIIYVTLCLKQKGKNHHCIYVIIQQKLTTLKNSNIFQNTCRNQKTIFSY